MKKLVLILAAAMLVLSIGFTTVFAQEDEVNIDNINAPLIQPDGENFDQPLPNPEEEEIREEQADERNDQDYDSTLPPADSLNF